MCGHGVEEAEIYSSKTSQDDVLSNSFQVFFSPSFFFFFFFIDDMSSTGFLAKQGVIFPACIYRTVLAQPHALHLATEIWRRPS